MSPLLSCVEYLHLQEHLHHQEYRLFVPYQMAVG
jgi:hypothetical protein